MPMKPEPCWGENITMDKCIEICKGVECYPGIIDEIFIILILIIGVYVVYKISPGMGMRGPP